MTNTSRIYVDARCVIQNAHLRNRPGFGPSTCGVLIIDNNSTEYEYSKYLGDKTVPEAEFEGLIFALDKASEVIQRTQCLEVFMDSALVVNWMNKKYRLKKEHIKPLYDKANSLAQRFADVKYFHHSRDSHFAKRADVLAQNEYKKHY